jgi:hypothetical protein
MNGEGSFTVLRVSENGITITLTPEGKEALVEEMADGDKRSDDILFSLLEEHVQDGTIDFIQPEEVGALTDSPIFGTDVERDDSGGIAGYTAVYWFPNYQVADPVEILLEDGEVFFNGEASEENLHVESRFNESTSSDFGESGEDYEPPQEDRFNPEDDEDRPDDEEPESFEDEFDLESGDIAYDDSERGPHITFFQYGRPWLQVKGDEDWDNIYAKIRRKMEREGFFPNLWHISDHGNPILVTDLWDKASR